MTISAAAAPAISRARNPRRDHIFYSTVSAATAIIVFLAFARTYYLRTYLGGPELSLLRAVHAAVFSAWMLLAVAQPLLIAARRTAMHRRIGVAAFALAPLMLVLGATLAVTSAREAHAPPGIDPAGFMLIPLFELVTFAPLVAAGLWFRRRPETHKRLMVLATISILGAASARLPRAVAMAGAPFFLVVDVLVLSLVVYDLLSRRRPHPATIWGGLFVIASQPLRLALSGTAAWLAVGHALVGR